MKTPHIDEYDFHLPETQIAQRPSEKRGGARLLHLPPNGSDPEDRQVADLPTILRGDEVLVVNDTRVVPARLAAQKESGGKVELLILPPGPNPNLHRAEAMTRSSRPLAPGSRLILPTAPGIPIQVVEASAGRALLEFPGPGGVRDALSVAGSVPLPPYIQRPDGPDGQDQNRYQTVFARKKGAVAAPTAGLHFSASLVTQLENKGIPVVSVTLHVGPGTFLPVRAENLMEHRVEPEWVAMGHETARVLNKAREESRRIIAVGTTVVRTLESMVGTDGSFEAGQQQTDLTILPGHTFRAVDGLLTNFHLPKSSLLVLVAEFGGKSRMMSAYDHAVSNGYRFYSYGDAMLIEKS